MNELFSEVTDIHWRTQDSKHHSALFYWFNNDSEEEIAKFKERIKDAKFMVCVTNINTGVDNPKIYFEEDFYEVQEDLLNHLYPFDFDSIYKIGITGTNGKTTTVDLISQICMKTNLNVLTIGTLGVLKNGECVDNFQLTTPAYIDLRKTLFVYGKEVDVLAMEVSSHAIDQNRVRGFEFDFVGWTSFSQDHLDYHGTEEDYFNTKLKIAELSKNKEVAVASFQLELKERITNAKVKVKYCTKVKAPKHPFFKANYNLENLEIALTALKKFEPKFDHVVPPPGRFNVFEKEDKFVIVDYAHTPDAIKNICKEVKSAFSDKKLLIVFGCGGNRDKSKRPLMGKAASRYSDYIIVTTDNPRLEDPSKIIEDVVPGITCDYETIVSRKEAISKALTRIDDHVVVIAGKGHEDYIDQNGEKTYFSDIEEVKRFLDQC